VDLISILIVGLVQGITEWIPVSSKTQVTFVYLTFLHGDTSSVIPILLYGHLGTVFAASLYFRKEIAGITRMVLRSPFDMRSHSQGETGFLFTALLFTGALGVPLLLLEQQFFPVLNGGLLYAVMGAGLIITGFLLLTQREKNLRRREEVTWKDGILTGFLQGLSILPGVSRAGTSTTGLIWRGFESESSFHLSFLLSIPTVLVAEVLLYAAGSLTVYPFSTGILISLSSFVVGYFTLDAILRVVKRVNIASLVFILGIAIILVGVFGAG
jgi:undecaprenyl-diphosphatase